MDAEKMKDALIKKVKVEQDSYRAKLAAQPPKEILNHAYEYAIRENILAALDGIDLTAPQMEALLASSSPLADIYRNWSKQNDPRYLEDISDTIEGHADDLIRQGDKLRKSPVYKYPAKYAWENDELEPYRLSNKANIACKREIDTTIRKYYDGFSFDSKAAVRDVVKKFGYERTLFVLAATVLNGEYDDRYSQANKNWAKTALVFDSERSSQYTAISHPVLVDAFVDTARHEYLLSLPLTKEDIKAEALNILSEFQNAREPNSPSGTHYMAQVSPDFLARAKTKDTDSLMSMLPFQTLSLSGLEGHKGTFALISKGENRFQKLVLRKPSVRKKLQEPPGKPKRPAKDRPKSQER